MKEILRPSLISDEHDNCGVWCKKKDSGNQSFKGLPQGKALNDTLLRPILDNFLERYIKRHEDVSNLGSSQPNESLHQMVSAKASKAL